MARVLGKHVVVCTTNAIVGDADGIAAKEAAAGQPDAHILYFDDDEKVPTSAEELQAVLDRDAEEDPDVAETMSTMQTSGGVGLPGGGGEQAAPDPVPGLVATIEALKTSPTTTAWAARRTNP